MDIWIILLDIVILLGAGAIMGGLFERARQSAIIGYLLAGALLGPNALGAVRGADQVLAVSELGVALLLFVIGLEFSWQRLRGMGKIALGSGSIQVLSTATVATGIASIAGLGLSASVALGAICALSSTACVLRVLTARNDIESAHGERALGVLLVQDMAVVPLVLVVSVLAEGGTAKEVFSGVARTTGIGLLLVGALYVVFYHLVPRVLAAAPIHANRELPLLVAVVSGLGSGVAAHAVGVSPALGAFVAGILLAGSPFAVQIRAEVSTLKVLLLTLFFTAMGMLTDPVWIASNALLVLPVVAVVVLGKALFVWASLRLFESRPQTAFAAGICLGQIGEFSFVLAGIARGRLLDEEMFMLVVSTTVITMLLTPYLVGFAPGLATRLAGRGVIDTTETGGEEEDREIALVIGFGPMGRAVAERIAGLGGKVVVVEQNPIAGRDARALGYGAVTGDARYADVLEHAGLRRAAVVVLTVPVIDIGLQILDLIRQHAPQATVLTRARFHTWVSQLEGAGADVVVDEEREVGVLLAEAWERRKELMKQEPRNPGKE